MSTFERPTPQYPLVFSAVAEPFSHLAPVPDALFFSYFPDTVFVPPRDDQGQVITNRKYVPLIVPRFGELSLELKDGKVVGRVTRWWDERRLEAEARRGGRRSGRHNHVLGLRRIHDALSNDTRTVFGADIPIYVVKAPETTFDMLVLFRDAMLAVNSVLPFDASTLPTALKAKLAQVGKFMDLSHFENVLSTDEILAVQSELVEQNHRYYNGVPLVPARWVDRVEDLRDAFVDVSSGFVLPLANPAKATIVAGALDFELRMDTRVEARLRSQQRREYLAQRDAATFRPDTSPVNFDAYDGGSGQS